MIRNFGGIAAPLTNLTRKDKTFEWTSKEQEAFDELKNRLLEDPVIAMADPSKPFEVETDASDYALGRQLEQRNKNGKLHPIAFYSKKLNRLELNYGILDKELIAIIEAFK